MANNLSSSLVVDTVAERALTVLQNRLAPLGAFTQDYSEDAAFARQSVQVAVATGTGSVSTNPTSFNTKDTNVSNVAVTVDHLSKSFGIGPQELNQGHKLQHQIDINLHAFGNKIQDVAFGAIIDPTVLTNASNVTVASSAFGASNLQTLWGQIDDSLVKNVILDGAYYAKLLPTALDSVNVLQNVGLAGFDGVFHTSRFSGAGSNVAGFACTPEVGAVVARMPADVTADESVADLIAVTPIEMPEIGLTIYLHEWIDTGTRTRYASFDLCFGANNTQTTAKAASFLLSA